MKRKIFFVLPFLLFLTVNVNAQKNDMNDSALFGEVNAAFKTGAFPAAAEYARQLEENFPKSILIAQTLVYHGEALFRIGRLDEAIEILEKADTYTEGNSEFSARGNYWLGRSYMAKSEYRDALYAFYCVVYKGLPSAQNEARYYYLSALYAGKSYFALDTFDKAQPLLETMLTNGTMYSRNEYVDGVQLLFKCYLETESYSRLASVYESLAGEENFFTERELSLLALDAGTAFEKMKWYRRAYNEYCKILEGNEPDLAAIALQRSYSVASEHPKEVGAEPGSVLGSAEKNLASYDSLLEEMWTRLGIDAFNSGDRLKAAQYFDNAQSGDKNAFDSIIGLYRAELTPSKAISILDSYASKTEEPNADYLCLYTKWYAVQGDWVNAVRCGSQALVKLEEKDSRRLETVYWYALSLYASNDFDGSYTALKSVSLSSAGVKYDSVMYRALILFARVLSKRGNNDAALRIYDDLGTHAALSDAERVDYAQLLFQEGYVSSAYKQASLVNTPQGNYVAALAAFNKRDWENAEKLFARVINSGLQNQVPYALFYSGYAQYKLGKGNAAFKALTDFATRYPSHNLAWNARMTAANAALQTGNYNAAVEQAESAVSSALNEENRQNALLLCASIHSDSGRYEKAIRVLSESSRRGDVYGVRARYFTAQVYARQGELAKSDALYEEIEKMFPENPLADESAYRRGELYYTVSEYASAVPRFSDYQKRFPKGQFLDASYFYCADSFTHIGQPTRAIMQYSVLLESFPESTYAYNARKNLVALYRAQGEYNNALTEARKIVSDYPEESAKDDLSEQISELKQLSSGMDEKLVKLYAQYEKNGKSSTLEGRRTGTELAEKLWSSGLTQKDAVVLAAELFALQSVEPNVSKEAAYAARTAVILAQSKRQQNENQNAGDRYLDAARFARMGGENTLAERSLYGAVEAYDAASLFEDAKAVYESMVQMYPSGPYTARAKKLIQQ